MSEQTSLNMKQYFTYGIWNIRKSRFKNPYLDEIDHNNLKNKFSGGLWAGKLTIYYSDWLLVTMIFPLLYRSGIAKGTIFELRKSTKLLELTPENYQEYTNDEGLIDFEKVKLYEAILYTQDLCDNVKVFESYYVESLQVLKYDVIIVKETVSIDPALLFTPSVRTYAERLRDTIVKRVLKSESFIAAKASMEKQKEKVSLPRALGFTTTMVQRN